MFLSNKKTLNIYLLVEIPLFILIILVFCFVKSSDQNVYENLTKFNNGWVYQDNSIVNISKLKMNTGIIKFSRKVNSTDVSGKSLCFRSKNITFNICLNDKIIYKFNPTIPNYCGKSYGICFHCVSIPDFDGEETLTIEADPIYNDSACFFDSMYLGNGGEYIKTELVSYMPRFIISVLIIIIGFVTLFVGKTIGSYNINTTAAISLGFFSVFRGVWTSTETMIIQLITGKPAAVHLLNYYALIFISVPLIIAVSEIVESKKNKCIYISCIMSVINLILNIVLNLLGIRDYHQMLNLTHFVIFATAIMSIYIIIESIIKKRADKKTYFVLGSGFLIVIIGTIADLIRYHFSRNAEFDSGFFARFAILIFMIVLSDNCMSNIVKMIELGKKAEIIKKLAYTDVLTDMPNRMAFVEDEKEYICHKNNLGVAVIQFDINNLKKVNDIYGHEAGDKHIIACAQVIKMSFGLNGKCYRMGGDEFIAVLYNENIQDVVKKAEEEMKLLIDEYNSSCAYSIPLEIAYGISFYDNVKKTLQEMEREADRMMYERKSKMKIKVM